MTHWRNGSHFVSRLTKRGFEIIGSGLFSAVLAKPGSDRVIKVYTYGKNGDATSDPWPEYVLWAAQNGYAGNFAPLVHSFRQFEGTSEAFYVAVMERLDCTMSEIRHAEPQHKSYARKDLLTAWDKWRWYKGDDCPVWPGSGAFMKAFRKAFGHRSTDTHGGNWMLRGDHLVLTDPLSGRGFTSSKRWRVSRDTGVLYQLAA